MGCANADRPAEPGGMVSSSLCADGYVLALAPDRVRALSWQAGSPLSDAQGEALALPRLWDDPETLFRTPGLHVAGPGAAPPGGVALQWAEDFEALAANIDRVADASGTSAQGWHARIRALDALPQPATRPRILYLTRAGGSAGAGTYVDAAIRKAGGVNAAAAPGWHTPDVETVLATDADIVLTSFFGSDYHGARDAALRHAALRRFIAARPRIDVPGRLWPCAGPGLVEATRRINAGVRVWEAGQR